jgi:hypothetical protein
MTNLMLKTKGQRVFHPYETKQEAIEAGKMLNFSTCLSLGVTDRQTWLELLRNDEIPRFYVETEEGLIVCEPEF